MSWKLITPPTGLAVSIEAARGAARASGTSLDAELEGKIRGYTEEVEHQISRALIHQTWRLTLHHFPVDIQLRYPPLVRVDHVKFYDQTGVQQTLDPQDYQIDGESEPGCIEPAPGRAWPAAARRINAVEVQIECGYGAGEAAVPPSIKEYILGMIANDYYPNPNVKYLGRLLHRHVVYG